MNHPVDRRIFLKETAGGLTFALTVAADPRILVGEALLSEAAAADAAMSASVWVSIAPRTWEVGRLDTVGHPILYGTTMAFLQHFGLESADQMPQLEEL